MIIKDKKSPKPVRMRNDYYPSGSCFNGNECLCPEISAGKPELNYDSVFSFKKLGYDFYSMKKWWFFVLALLVFSSLAYAQTVNTAELKIVLIDSIKDYLSSQTPKLEKAELKDLIVVYLSTKGDTADLSGIGSFSGKKLFDIYNKAKGTCIPNCVGKCGGASDGCGGSCNAACIPACTSFLDRIAPMSGTRYGIDDITFSAGSVHTYCLPIDRLYPTGDYTILKISTVSLGVVPGGDIALKLTSPDGKVFLRDSPTSSNELLTITAGYSIPEPYITGTWTLEITAKVSSRVSIWWYLPY